MMSWSSTDLSNQFEKIVFQVKSPCSITTRPDLAKRAGETWLIVQVSKISLTLVDKWRSSPEGRFKWLELVMDSMDSVQDGSRGPSNISHKGLLPACLSLIILIKLQAWWSQNYAIFKPPNWGSYRFARLQKVVLLRSAKVSPV